MQKSKRPNSRGKKPHGRYDKDRTREEDRELQPKVNDFSWYNKYPDLIQAAARLPFVNKPGMNVTIGQVYAPTSSGIATQYEAVVNVPGVWGISWMPFVGISRDNQSPVSIAAKELYAKVRSAFSGTLKADPPDYIIYLLALDSVFSYIASLKRIYRTIGMYSPYNLSFPTQIMAALGFTAEDVQILQDNKAQFLECINQLVLMTRNFHCPAVFPLFNRHYWLNDNVYGDRNSPSAQMYVFHQKYFLQYTTADTPDGVPAGALEYKEWAVGGVPQLFEFGKSLIQALAASDDAYTISGYLMKAFEGYPSFTMDLLSPNELLTPAYDELVLQQIKNSFELYPGIESKLASNPITQDPKTNTILCGAPYTISFASGSAVINRAPILDLYTDNPSVEDIVEATRLQCAVRFTGKDESSVYAELIGGTELVLNNFIYTYLPTTGEVDSLEVTPVLRGTTTQNGPWAGLLLRASAFHHHPILASVNGQLFKTGMLTDVDNLTAPSFEDLKAIHRYCLYSEFNSFNV